MSGVVGGEGGLEVRVCASEGTVLRFNTGQDDLLSSSVPDLQNRSVLRPGGTDERVLLGDCWSEFRDGYVKSGVRRVLGGRSEREVRVERGEISMRE